MRARVALAVASALLLGAGAGCGPKGRIKEPDEERIVGSTKAGAETYDRLIDQSVAALLDQHARRIQGRAAVAFVGIENRSAEPLNDIREAIYEIIDTQLVNRASYVPLSMRFVEAAKREAGVRGPEELLLPSGRRRFLAVLEREGSVPDYLLWAKLTSMTTEASSVTERDYLLTLELVDARTGETAVKKTARLTKEYR